MTYSHLMHQVIEFNQEVLKSEIDFEPGCRARVKGFDVVDADVVKLVLDFSEFEEYNKKFLQPNYYDKNGNPTLYWYETGYYPNNCISCDYFERSELGTPNQPFTVVENDPVLKIKEKARDIRHELMERLDRAGVLTNGAIDSLIDEVLIKHLSK